MPQSHEKIASLPHGSVPETLSEVLRRATLERLGQAIAQKVAE